MPFHPGSCTEQICWSPVNRQSCRNPRTKVRPQPSHSEPAVSDIPSSEQTGTASIPVCGEIQLNKALGMGGRNPRPLSRTPFDSPWQFDSPSAIVSFLPRAHMRQTHGQQPIEMPVVSQRRLCTIRFPCGRIPVTSSAASSRAPATTRAQLFVLSTPLISSESQRYGGILGSTRKLGSSPDLQHRHTPTTPKHRKAALDPTHRGRS